MGPGIAQSKVSSTKEARLRKAFCQARLQTVVIGRCNVAKFIEEAEGAIAIPGRRVEHTMCGPENERVPVNEISQLMRRAANITDLGDQVLEEFALHAQIVLIDVRCAEVWINEKHSAAAASAAASE